MAKLLKNRVLLMVLSTLATTASVAVAVEYPQLYAAICGG